MTGISESTLLRAKKREKKGNLVGKLEETKYLI
jgi:hypothetical protein